MTLALQVLVSVLLSTNVFAQSATSTEFGKMSAQVEKNFSAYAKPISSDFQSCKMNKLNRLTASNNGTVANKRIAVIACAGESLALYSLVASNPTAWKNMVISEAKMFSEFWDNLFKVDAATPTKTAEAYSQCLDAAIERDSDVKFGYVVGDRGFEAQISAYNCTAEVMRRTP